MTNVRDISELLEIVKRVSSCMKGEKSDSLRLECMDGIGTYITTVNVGSQFSRWVKSVGRRTMPFPASQVYDIRMYALKPFPLRIDEAVYLDGDKIIVDLTPGLQYESFRLEVGFRMDEDILRGLVFHRSSCEPLADKMTYNLSAQLTDPESLQPGFKEVEVDDYPVTARVHIQEDIDTAFPFLKTYKQLHDLEAEMLGDYDPRHGTKMIGIQKRRHVLKNQLMRYNPRKTIRELLSLVDPSKFLGYLKTERDFRLHRCAWGATEIFEKMGSLSIPKAIEVTTRTDLTISRPASNGTLLYESRRFSEDVKNIVNDKND